MTQTSATGADVEVGVIIDRTPSEVWAYVRNIASHVDWMADAAEIRFLSDQTEGTGTSFECDTVVGPLRVTDVMTITSWVDDEEMGVRHSGVVTGEGVFLLTPVGSGQTKFSWHESLKFPWWMAGSAGAWVARPVLKIIWRRNLSRLKRNLEVG